MAKYVGCFRRPYNVVGVFVVAVSSRKYGHTLRTSSGRRDKKQERGNPQWMPDGKDGPRRRGGGGYSTYNCKRLLILHSGIMHAGACRDGIALILSLSISLDLSLLGKDKDIVGGNIKRSRN